VRNASKLPLVPLTVAERTLGSSLGATHCSMMMRWPSFQKDKASISTGLPKAGVCQSLGEVLKIISTRAEQPFGTIVDASAGRSPPVPSPSITRRRTPAALAVGVHSFEGAAAVVDFRDAKNEFNRPPSFGLRTCTILDEHLKVPVIGDEGSGRSL
jgi:hypothetical protein